MANIILPQVDILQQTDANTKFIVEQGGVLKRFPYDLSNLSFNNGSGENSGSVAEDVKIHYLGGKAVFFGSDLTDGAENNGKSFVDYLIEEKVFDTVQKYCRSHCTLGDYGLNNYSNLIDTYASDARDANFIFLELYNEYEYYFNNNVSIETIKNSAMQVFQKIRSYNQDAIIYLLIPFLGFDGGSYLTDFALLFEYTIVKNAIALGVVPIGLVNRMGHSPNYFTSSNYLTSFGHYNAADEIYYNLFQEYRISNSPRVIHVTGSAETIQLGRDYITYSSVDIQPRLFDDMLINGVPLRVQLLYAKDGAQTVVEFNDLTQGYMTNDYGEWFYMYAANGGGSATTTMLLARNTETSDSYGFGMVYYADSMEIESERDEYYSMQFLNTPDGFEYEYGALVATAEGMSTIPSLTYLPAIPAEIIDTAGLTGHVTIPGDLKLYQTIELGASFIYPPELMTESGFGGALDYYNGSWCVIFSEEEVEPENYFTMLWRWTETEVY